MPHYYLTVSIQLDALMSLRTKLNAFSKTKISLTDMVLKAASLSALKVPYTNASWMGDFVRVYKNVNMGIAV